MTMHSSELIAERCYPLPTIFEHVELYTSEDEQSEQDDEVFPIEPFEKQLNEEIIKKVGSMPKLDDIVRHSDRQVFISL